jgi:hypothetical protein
MPTDTYAHPCSRMLTYAHVCSRMLTYAGEKVSLGCQKLDKLRAVLAKADEWCVHPLNLEPSYTRLKASYTSSLRPHRLVAEGLIG